MSRRLLLLGIATAALTLPAALWWLQRAGERRAPDAAPRVLAAPEHAADVALASDGAAEGLTDGIARPVALDRATTLPGADPGDALAAGIAPARLTGRITRTTDGSAVSEVTVDATTDAITISTVTAEDGSYRLDVAAGLVACALVVHSGPDTVGCREDLNRRLAAGEKLTRDLQVGSGGRLSGWVVDARGAPVPRADVLGCNTNPWSLTPEQLAHPDRNTTANAVGEFTLAGLGPVFTVTAQAPGLVAHKLLSGRIGEGVVLGGAGWAGGTGGGASAVAADPAQPGALTVVLSPARTIRGRVIDAHEQPVSGATVSLQLVWNLLAPNFTAATDVSRQPPPSRELHTDADGAFAFEDSCSERCELHVFHDDHVGWNGEHAPGDPDLLIRLDDGASLTGVVISAATGAPLAGASVRAFGRNHGDVIGTGRSTTTDAQGLFSVGGFPSTSRAVAAVLADGHAVQVVQPVTVGDQDTSPVRIVIEPERVLSGLVVDAAGAPVADVRIEIEGDRLVDLDGIWTPTPPTWERRFRGLDRTVTDGEGRFRLGQLYDGEFRLRAEHPLDDSVFVTTTARSGTTDLRLVLDAATPHGVVFVGTVRDAITHQPITSFHVTPNVRAADGKQVGLPRMLENAQGAFRITGLDPGQILLQVSAPGYMLRSFPEQDYAEGEHRLDVELSVMRSLEVRVLDRLRRPVSAQLSFTDEDDHLLWVYPGIGIGTQFVSTDASGWAIYRNLPAARLMARVQLGWIGTPQEFPLDLRSAPQGPVEFVLDRCRPVKLQLVILGGTAEVAAAIEHGDSAQRAAALQAALSQGTAWKLDTACTLHALAADGREAAQGELHLGDDAAAAQPNAAPSPEAAISLAPHTSRISIPEEPLSLELSADGYASVTRAWQPGEDFVIVVLTRG